MDLVKSLLDSGADAKATGNNGYTALMIAVIHDNDKLVKLLLPKSDAKGQLILKCPYEKLVSPKIATKLFLDFCPEFFCSFLKAFLGFL